MSETTQNNIDEAKLGKKFGIGCLSFLVIGFIIIAIMAPNYKHDHEGYEAYVKQKITNKYDVSNLKTESWRPDTSLVELKFYPTGVTKECYIIAFDFESTLNGSYTKNVRNLGFFGVYQEEMYPICHVSSTLFHAPDFVPFDRNYDAFVDFFYNDGPEPKLVISDWESEKKKTDAMLDTLFTE